MYKYKVSIVMAVYNVEPFLREAVDSVIRQDIGFQNIQLIMVDDGSPDNSGAICDEYAKKYPDNIVVIHKENGGVSSARNAGLGRVEGEIVNFLDPDDKLDPNAASAAYRFFQEHGDATDVVSFPMKFFDAQSGSHTLNYKYKNGTRVIDLDKEWENPQCSMSSTFIRSSCFKTLRFDLKIAQAEDLHLLQRVLLQKRTMGVLSETTYWYRKRGGGEQSATQSRLMNKNGYVPMMKYVQMDTVNYCLEKNGYVPKFIQYVLMYDLQWQLKRVLIPDGVLTEEEKREYYDLVHSVLCHIDNDVIQAQRNIYQEHIFLAYKLKYRDSLHREIREDDIVICGQEEELLHGSDTIIKLEFLEVEEQSCVVEGVVNTLPGLLDMCRIAIKVDGKLYEAEAYRKRKTVIAFDQQEAIVPFAFKVRIPLTAKEKHPLEFFCLSDGVTIPMKAIRYGRYFPVSSAYENNYFAKNNWIVTCTEKGIQLEPWSKRREASCERALCWELWKTKKRKCQRAVLSRLLLKVLRPFKRKKLWLISDRAAKAGDNGEAFFRYVRQHHPEIDARFVINGECADYMEMKKIGPVVKKDSYQNKILHLLSDCVISSQGEIAAFNPFHRKPEPYRNLLAKDRYIFLQHGITGNDLSQWVGRFSKNLRGFVTAAVPEYMSIVNGGYEYSENEVWLTGFARFDRLYQDSKKWITIMPTWRKYLMGKLDSHTGKWTLAPEAENSEYVQFYKQLLNHPGLLETAKKTGYKIKFLPHPNLQEHLYLFGRNDSVEYLGIDTHYRDIYAKSDLVLTDYSSAVFDFAYLRKPVIYAQFDLDAFYSGAHTLERGYFDYERDGFGEVEFDLESTVDRIIEYMENGCKLKDKYRERIDNFFAFNDQNNCERVFNKIIELEKSN